MTRDLFVPCVALRGEPRRTYSAPRVESMGDVRDAVMGASGATDESGGFRSSLQPHPFPVPPPGPGTDPGGMP
jgi:hypothetical protein